MSKSRGERGNKTPSSNQNPPPVTQNTIVPGRFTEYDWNDLVENESCENFISDIVNDVADLACDIIFKNIISDRIAPYSVFSAKQLLLDLIEWQFIECDNGEKIEEEPAWLEDEEPLACVTDSWAQGAVPVVGSLNRIQSPLTEVMSIDDENEYKNVDSESQNVEEQSETNECSEVNLEDNIDETEIKEEDEQKKTVEIEKCVRMQSDEMTENSKQLEEQPVAPSPPKNVKSSNSSRSSYKKHKGSLPSFAPISLTPVTDDRPKPGTGVEDFKQHGAPLHSADSLFKSQHGRPPGVKEVVFDGAGNVVKVQKINVTCLPDHRVKTKFTVEEVEQDTMKFSGKSKSKDVKSNVDKQNYRKTSVNPNVIMKHVSGREADMLRSLRTPLPPSLVDTADVSKGVIIKEGTLSKRGSKIRPLLYADEGTLKPIQSGRGHKLDVQDIINKTKPTLNSYSRSKPLPAILM